MSSPCFKRHFSTPRSNLNTHLFLGLQLPPPSALSRACHLDILQFTGQNQFSGLPSETCSSCCGPISVTSNFLLPGFQTKALESSLTPLFSHPSSSPPADPVCSAVTIHPGSGTSHHPLLPPWPTAPSPLVVGAVPSCPILLVLPLTPTACSLHSRHGGFVSQHI